MKEPHPPSGELTGRTLRLAVRLGFLNAHDAGQLLPEIRDQSDPTRALSGLGILGIDQADRLRKELGDSRLAPAPAGLPSTLPARFGDYELLEILGRGAMGVVYRARQPSLKRVVAVKILLPDRVETGHRRFRREGRIAAHFHHPNLLPVYEVGECDGCEYIAMQHVKGKTLSRIPREPVRDLVRHVRDAASAVHFLHGQGVLHRDLKPDNLMVEDSPRPEAPGRVFVMDFGLAKMGTGPSSLSGNGAIIGTPAYMAPEQTRGIPADERADIYSLGATLYELLTRRPPFVGRNIDEIYRKIREYPPVPVRTLTPQIDPELESIVLKCLEKNHRARFASAGALAEALSRYLDGPSPKPPSRPPLRRRRRFWRWVGLALPAFVATLAALWMTRC